MIVSYYIGVYGVFIISGVGFVCEGWGNLYQRSTRDGNMKNYPGSFFISRDDSFVHNYNRFFLWFEPIVHVVLLKYMACFRDDLI